MFFDNWFGLLRVLVVGTLTYAALVTMLRISGNRTLSKMSAFDLVVTVALGSTLASTLLTSDVALFEGVLALALLIGLQFIVAWLSVRSPRWRGWVKADAVLLAWRGALLRGVMRRERITEEEVNAALRAKGLESLEAAEAVVLESDGTVTVIPRGDDKSLSALRDVHGFPPAI